MPVPVVDAGTHIGVGASLPSRPRTPKGYRDGASDPTQPFGSLLRQFYDCLSHSVLEGSRMGLPGRRIY